MENHWLDKMMENEDKSYSETMQLATYSTVMDISLLNY